VVALQAFVFAGLIRLYFVTINKANTVYDQHTVIQIIYAEATMLGFFLLVMVAGAGGIWVYGKSILSDVPVLQEFLPGGDLLIPLTTLAALLTLTLLVSTILRESVTKEANKKSKQSPNIEGN
jgi:DMSO reductase anchor subunit